MKESRISFWDEESGTDVPLSVEEAAVALALRDDVRLQWRKSNGMHGRGGRMILIDRELCERLLRSRRPEHRDGLDATWLSERG